MKRALFTFMTLAQAAAASWDPRAWPSEECIRVADTSVVMTVSNVWAQQHVETWTQTYTWSNLPAIPAPFGRIGYIAGSTNASRTWTNEYLTDVQVDVSTGAVAGWGPGTTYSTNTHITALGDVVTTVLAHYTNGLSTNLNLQVRDLWAWDSYQAMLERWHAMQNHIEGVTEDAVTRANDEGQGDPKKPRFYRGVREALYYTKAWIKDALYGGNSFQWVDDSKVESDWDLPEQPADVSWYSLLLHYTTALARVSAPTNYFDWDPWRSVGGYGGGQERVTTGEWVFVAPGTYTVETVCGNLATQVVARTNTFPVSVPWVCTNESIAEGFTSLDYGWKYVPGLFTQMVVSVLSANDADALSKLGVEGTNYATLAAAWASESWGEFGSDYVVWGDEWHASRVNLPTNTPINTLCTRTEHSGAFYVRPVSYSGGFADVDGLGLVLTNWTTIAGSEFPATYTGRFEYALGTNYALPHDAAGYVAGSGAKVDALYRKWLIRWNFDYAAYE